MDLTKLAIDQLVKMALHNPAFKLLVLSLEVEAESADAAMDQDYTYTLRISTLDNSKGYNILLQPNERYSLLEIVQKALAAGVLESEDKK